MLESKSYYFPYGENPKSSKGWVAFITFEGECNVNRGCGGFKTKKEAEQWLRENLEYKIKCFNYTTLKEAKVYKR